jgi:hypothetical protein
MREHTRIEDDARCRTVRTAPIDDNLVRIYYYLRNAYHWPGFKIKCTYMLSDGVLSGVWYSDPCMMRSRFRDSCIYYELMSHKITE